MHVFDERGLVECSLVERSLSELGLDGLDGYSERARAFLARAAWRGEPDPDRVPTELMRARSSSGELVPAPPELAVRREGFAQKYGGLVIA